MSQSTTGRVPAQGGQVTGEGAEEEEERGYRFERVLSSEAANSKQLQKVLGQESGDEGCG